MKHSVKLIFISIAVWSCTASEPPVSAALLERFPAGELPFEVRRETFYEFGEWNWHDSVVEKRVFPDLMREDMAMLRDTVGSIPAGLAGRFVALRRFGPVNGCTALLYRRDIGPVDEELGPDTLDYQFVVVTLDENGVYADRKIIGRWQAEIGLLAGKLGKDLEVKTAWYPIEPESDSLTTLYSMGKGCRWSSPEAKNE